MTVWRHDALTGNTHATHYAKPLRHEFVVGRGTGPLWIATDLEYGYSSDPATDKANHISTIGEEFDSEAAAQAACERRAAS